MKVIEDYTDISEIQNKVKEVLQAYLFFTEVEIYILGNLSKNPGDEEQMMDELIKRDFFDQRLIEDILISRSPSKISAYQVTYPLELRGRVIGLFYIKTSEELTEDQHSILWAFSDFLAMKIDELQMPKDINPLSKAKIKQISDSIFNNLRNFLEASLVKLKVLEQKNQELVEINKFKIDLINNVSHELRTPLVGILGFSNMLKRHQSRPEIINEAADEIVQAGNRLSRMIDDLIQLNRANNIGWQVNFEKIDLTEVIFFAHKTLTHFRDKHQFHFNFDEKLPRVKADKRLLLQIIENLMTNAIKYSPDGGEIKVYAGAVDNGTKVAISISDCGIGMTEEDVEKVFDRFYRVKSAKTNKIHGLGLGLAICKDLAVALDADLECESKLGEGSKFTLTIPTYQ